MLPIQRKDDIPGTSSVDPKKTQTVRDWPIPTKEKEVRSFLGLASYYRRFIPGFATLAAPLHRLTKKDAVYPLQWNEECQSGFSKLKEASLAPQS